MEAVYPAGASALSRGRRRRAAPRARRTTPVTFAEIKEVDEESEEACGAEAVPGVGAGAGAGALERRRRDELAEPLGAQFAEFRRRRARRDVLREPAEEPPCPPRAASEPRPAPLSTATRHGAGASAAS